METACFYAGRRTRIATPARVARSISASHRAGAELSTRPPQIQIVPLPLRGRRGSNRRKERRDECQVRCRPRVKELEMNVTGFKVFLEGAAAEQLDGELSEERRSNRSSQAPCEGPRNGLCLIHMAAQAQRAHVGPGFGNVGKAVLPGAV